MTAGFVDAERDWVAWDIKSEVFANFTAGDLPRMFLCIVQVKIRFIEYWPANKDNSYAYK